MTQTAHTPGPWHIGDPPEFWHEADGINVTLEDSHSISIGAQEWAQLATAVVKFRGEEKETPVGQANARLIAASPDMYEALDKLTGEVRACWGMAELEIRQAVGNTNFQVVLDHIEASIAALKKAGSE